MTRVGVVDCGISNLGSMLNALEFLGVESCVVQRPPELRDCSHVVLPGDGTFPSGMRMLRQRGLDEAVQAAAAAGKMILGVCLGMQLLAEQGEEFEPTNGLGLTAGRVVRMQPNDPTLPVPQIGWSEVSFYRETRLTAGIGERPSFYFMQSYAFADPSAPAVAGVCHYGGPIVAVIEQGHVFGVQFHPEKSQRAGLRLLRNFCELG
jgi:imidazole glycerol-phosphate synthase subunit HisH